MLFAFEKLQKTDNEYKKIKGNGEKKIFLYHKQKLPVRLSHLLVINYVMNYNKLINND
jgi:hypothetical protein